MNELNHYFIQMSGGPDHVGANREVLDEAVPSGNEAAKLTPETEGTILDGLRTDPNLKGFFGNALDSMNNGLSPQSFREAFEDPRLQELLLVYLESPTTFEFGSADGKELVSLMQTAKSALEAKDEIDQAHYIEMTNNAYERVISEVEIALELTGELELDDSIANQIKAPLYNLLTQGRLSPDDSEAMDAVVARLQPQVERYVQANHPELLSEPDEPEVERDIEAEFSKTWEELEEQLKSNLNISGSLEDKISPDDWALLKKEVRNFVESGNLNDNNKANYFKTLTTGFANCMADLDRKHQIELKRQQLLEEKANIKAIRLEEEATAAELAEETVQATISQDDITATSTTTKKNNEDITENDKDITENYEDITKKDQDITKKDEDAAKKHEDVTERQDILTEKDAEAERKIMEQLNNGLTKDALLIKYQEIQESDSVPNTVKIRTGEIINRELSRMNRAAMVGSPDEQQRFDFIMNNTPIHIRSGDTPGETYREVLIALDADPEISDETKDRIKEELGIPVTYEHNDVTTGTDLKVSLEMGYGVDENGERIPFSAEHPFVLNERITVYEQGNHEFRMELKVDDSRTLKVDMPNQIDSGQQWGQVANAAMTIYEFEESGLTALMGSEDFATTMGDGVYHIDEADIIQSKNVFSKLIGGVSAGFDGDIFDQATVNQLDETLRWFLPKGSEGATVKTDKTSARERLASIGLWNEASESFNNEKFTEVASYIRGGQIIGTPNFKDLKTYLDAKSYHPKSEDITFDLQLDLTTKKLVDTHFRTNPANH